ncbi:MAG: Cof-type HAD-IIB family hydrolase [Candidatus Treponema excrementipullorum]|uniref:Cof-type HAD-IIB family hydrolase n=1 Tax=Candidatus Treponema excrementipullorum TaxID=2838768 RepID=A0A9E2L5Z4_9SPIR|nr:Cof-type HAD-IIB family hydrolase [Candidatus Treponema excrementipullorum]MCI6479325.1 Cof-type HAD-IIB family hydrolase [Spirochaetia bacterium]MCI6953138.1 Cof-type HAD-IIB family hydrolase [Spirochaetia bacterium]MCI7589837.1 Cof-type HAD-IIB family hydrolase [Spirochaetia bacterium]MDD7012350.1 Cof-type HAD-IIB family hydrolase [Candidatus Treponema excrementipullorum]
MEKLPVDKIPAKIIAIDLDDTLLREDLTISDHTVEVLEKVADKGIYIVLCSGRTENAILPFVRRLGITGREEGRFIIAQNGAIVSDLHLRRELLVRTVDVNILVEAHRMALERNLFCEVYDPETVYAPQDNKWTRIDVGLTGLKMEILEDFESFLKKGHPKMVVPGDPEVLIEFQNELRQKFGSSCVIFVSKPYFLEIMPYNTGKGEALEWLSRRLGIPRENTMAFGDSMNDESMIRYAGNSVAMVNGRDEIKNLARYVTEKTNNEDGLAHFIEKFVL